MSDYIVPVQRIETVNVNDLCQQAADERQAQIVKWLRGQTGAWSSEAVADAIERGEYLQTKPE